MGIKIAVVGVGAFAQCFIPLFKAHPLVDEVALCDLDADKLARNAAEHGVARTLPSLDAACESDVDAVAIITQNWLHGPQAAQALKAGKHVYSAVPAGISLEEIAALVEAAKASGRVYMIGETSYYYPAVVYCRAQHRRGAFGRIVYAEAEYYHDWDHGLYEVMQWRGGERWLETAGGPPMHYPTHSTSAVISVTGARMTHVSCQGVVDQHPDGIYRADVNRWGNTFSNESALFRMSDGSACRINEFRRIGHPGTVRLSVWGTEGSFELNEAGAVWVTKNAADKVRLDDQLALRADRHGGTALVHPVERLPAAYAAMRNCHEGSHQFLVDDFVTACATGSAPPNHVWDAARYVVPGLIAHESAMLGGALLNVPDFGD